MVRRPTEEIVTNISNARAALSEDEDDKYKAIKQTLPSVTFAGTFKTRKAENLKSHSGLCPIDFDHLSAEKLQEARFKLQSDPSVVFLYISPSGEGLKGAVLLDPFPSDANEHAIAFSAVRNYIEETHGLKVDKGCSDVSRLAFLSHDPDCYCNPQPQPLKTEEWRDLSNDEKTKERLSQILESGFLGSIKTQPPLCPVILQHDNGRVLGETGNIITIEGLQKSGKSAVLSAILGAAVAPEGRDGDFFGFQVPEREGFVLHFDCEQSPKDHFRLIEIAVKFRAGLDEIPPCLRSHSLLQASAADRWSACQLAAEETVKHGPIRMVIFDGGADLLRKLNDEESSNAMVEEMHAFAVRYACLVVIVIHENPNSEGAKTRGHFGSQLWRKAQSCLGVEKGKDEISEIFSKFLRSGKSWKGDESVFFKFDTDSGHHRSTANPTEGRKAAKIAEKTASKRQANEELIRNVMTEPAMSHTELQNAIMRHEKIQERAARDRIKALTGEFIRKRPDGRYESAK